MDLEVVILDDLEAVARAVATHNRWLTYAEPLHHLREVGLGLPALDAVGDRPLDHIEVLVSVDIFQPRACI